MEQAKADCPLEGEPQIDKWLAELNEAFHKWRYSFDYNPRKVSMEGIRFLQMLLYHACRVPLPGEPAPADAAALAYEAKVRQGAQGSRSE